MIRVPVLPSTNVKACSKRSNRSSIARSQAHGAGLGLSIARELARQHGGDVTIAETTESCFVLTLRNER